MEPQDEMESPCVGSSMDIDVLKVEETCKDSETAPVRCIPLSEQTSARFPF